MTFTIIKSAGLETHAITFILQMNNIKPLRDLVACMRLPIQIHISLTQQYSFFHSARISFLFFFLQYLTLDVFVQQPLLTTVWHMTQITH